MTTKKVISWFPKSFRQLNLHIFQNCRQSLTCQILVLQKQTFRDVLQNRCSWKFCYIHRKTTVLAEGLKTCNFFKKRLQHRCFPVNIAKCLRTALFIEHLWWLLLVLQCAYKNTDYINLKYGFVDRWYHFSTYFYLPRLFDS